MAQSGHLDCAEGCPLLGVKRTSKFKSVMSAFDPSATSGITHYSIRLQQTRLARTDASLR